MADTDKMVAAILAAAQVSSKQPAERYVEQYREILALLDMEDSDERRAAAQRKAQSAAKDASAKKRTT